MPAGSWGISIGLVALPIMCLHDLLLTGGPFFWASVAASYSATAESAGRLPGVSAVARDLADLVAGQAAVTVLAVIGMVVLAVRARWSILVAVLALGPGIAVFLLVLAARHTFVDPRYLVPISVALIFAAAVGLSAVRVPDLAPPLGRLRALGGRAVRDRSIASLAAMSLVVAALAIAFAPAIGPLDRATRATITSARHVARTADRAIPRIRTELGQAAAGSSSGAAASDAGTPSGLVVVPVAIRPRVAVELDRPLGQVGWYRDLAAWAAGTPTAGQLVLVDVDHSAPASATAAFRLSTPRTVDGMRLVPLISDASNGTFLLKVTGP